MKILIRNVDNVVIYARPDLALDESGIIGDGWRDNHYTTANARIEEAELPEHWAGAVFAYAGGVWAVFDQAQFDKVVQSTKPALADYDAALTSMLDAEARTHHYADRISCSVRAGYPGLFQAEGIAFATWMDAQNAKGYQILKQFQQGLIAQPTTAEFLAMLDPMVWPT